MRVRWKPMSILGSLALGLAFLASPGPANAQAVDIPVTNGSFEQPDPTSSVKPLGWFRRGYGEVQPANNVADPVWEYVTNASDAYDGTDYVRLKAQPPTYGNPVSWELEGLTPGVINGDNKGQGSLLPTTVGGLYEVSVYARWTGTATGQLRMRVQHQGTNAPNAATVTTGGLYDFSRPTNGWVKLTSGPFIARSNFVSPRLYGNLLSGDVQASFDLVEFKQLALPVTVTGIVTDTLGDPVVGAGVGINVPGKNGMADPLGSATTGEDGRFTITFPKLGDDFVAQAWLQNNSLSASVPVNLAGDTAITYDPAPLANILLSRPVVAASSLQLDGTQEAETTNDGNIGTRWASRGGVDGDDAKNPHYIVYDMGQTINFEDIRSAEVWWENARAGHWQIRVSNTPPDPAMYEPQNDGDNALALQYGTLVYDSEPGAADLSYIDPTLASRFIDVVDQFGAGSGRYVMIAMLQQGPFPNHSIYEFKLLVPAVSVTGQLVNEVGTPVQGFVMTSPDGNNQTATDEEGNFDLQVPQTAAPTQYIAHSLQGPTVYTLSNTFIVSPQSASLGQIRLNSAPNEVPAGAAVDTYAAIAPGENIVDDNLPPGDLVDHAFNTRWSSATIIDIDQNVTPANPIYVIVDMGAPKTINTLLVDWETARPSQYRVQVASTYNFAGRSGGNWQDVKVSATTPDSSIAYNWGGGHYIDIIDLPERSAQYIRLVLESRQPPFTNFSVWEVQAANLTAMVVPLSQAREALRIAGGLDDAPANIGALNAVTTGDSANVIDILDAVELARQGR